MNADLTLPIRINENLAVLTGISYESFTASFNPNRNKESFTGLTVKLGANIKHNSKWSGTYIILPKLSSDFKSIKKNDFQFGGAVLMKYQKTENFNVKFGVYANSEMFSAFVVPMLGFYYISPGKRLETKVILPLAGNLNYRVTEQARFGLNFKGQIRSYNVNTPIQLENDRYIVKSANDLIAYFQYDLKNNINFQFGFGRSLGRSYRMFNEQVNFGMPLVYFGDNRQQLNTDFSDSWLIKVGAFYRLKL